MDEWIKMLDLPEGLTSVVTVWEVLFGGSLAALLSILVGLVYRRVQAEGTYSQTLVHTFVLMSMITAFIMLIIGSNIARAFSLVGALSVIRFRTAIKSPLDVGFVFLSMAIGMACGTGFYAVAVVGAILISVVVVLLQAFNFGSYPARRESLLSVLFPVDVDYESALDPLLGRFFEAYSFAYAETVRQGTLIEVVYSVRPRESIATQEIVAAVREVNRNLKVSYRIVRHAIEVP